MVIRKNMNSYITTDLAWTLPPKPFIITQRVISFNNVIYQINTNKINLLEITKRVFQFFKFSNIFNFCLMLLFFETLLYANIENGNGLKTHWHFEKV